MAGKKFTELMGLTAGIVPEKDNNSSPAKAKTAPGQMMDLAIQRDDAFDRAEKAEAALRELEARLREEQSQTGFLEIPLSQLHKVAGRQRKLTPEERQQLKDNLRQHPLATPITVEVRAKGGFNIVSGSNRYEIYKELNEEFGDKPTIRASLTDAPPEKIDDLSFFANLLHSSLPAYEKYVGLKKIRDKDPTNPLKHKELAELTGITRTTVTDLFKFDELPAEALDLLKSKPSALGSKGVAAFAAMKDKVSAAKVVEAVRRLVTENISEVEAIKFASEGKSSPAPSSRPAPTTINAGRAKFCTMFGVKKTLRVDFETEGDRIEAEAALKAVLEKQAARRKEENAGAKSKGKN